MSDTAWLMLSTGSEYETSRSTIGPVQGGWDGRDEEPTMFHSSLLPQHKRPFQIMLATRLRKHEALRHSVVTWPDPEARHYLWPYPCTFTVLSIRI